MPIYVVQARGEGHDALVRARFVAEAFSWPAFLVTTLWLAYRRLWLALLCWIAFDAVLFLLLARYLTGGATIAAFLLAKLYVGFEGPAFRVGKEARRASLTDVLAARDRDEAEATFFRRQAGAEGVGTSAEPAGADA